MIIKLEVSILLDIPFMQYVHAFHNMGTGCCKANISSCSYQVSASIFKIGLKFGHNCFLRCGVFFLEHWKAGGVEASFYVQVRKSSQTW